MLSYRRHDHEFKEEINTFIKQQLVVGNRGWEFVGFLWFFTACKGL